MPDDLPADIRAAFGVPSGSATRLPGGAGTCWQAGGLVFKPGHHPVVGAWLADVCAELEGTGFQVPQPIRANDGSWVVDGWTAWTRVDGEPNPVRQWPELVAASRAFHAAIAGVAAPRWLGRRRNRWAVAERATWDDEPVEIAPELSGLVTALRAAARPIELPSQLIHGDLAGNVLFAVGQPPAVIDFSPGVRPAAYPLAVAAVDVLTWSGASPEILDELAEEDEIDQLLLRAAIWRLITESLGRPDADSRDAVRRANEPVVELLLSRVSGEPMVGPDIRELVGQALGDEITELRPVTGGHSRARTYLADRAGGGSVFVKTGPELDIELAVYDALDGNAFLPRRLGGRRMLVLESLAPDGWVREWTPDLIDATRALMDQLHALPAPPGVPVLGAVANPWDAIAADPRRLLRLDVCSERWLAGHLEILRTAAAQAPVDGESLIHRDVRAANLWHRDGRLLLADWASAAIGNPWLDHHLWLVTLHAEGGPAPEANQGPDAAGHAALIAGQQPLLTPSRDADPILFEQRRRYLDVALSWAARLL